jgi:hypothetical protein
MRNRRIPDINSYGDLLPAWKHKLIIQRALARGVPPEDLAEVQQEVIMAVLGYQHDPSKGASEKSALYLVIDRQISQFQRAHARRIGLHERYRAELRASDADQVVTNDQAGRDLRADIASVVQAMSHVEQQICAGLADGTPVSALIKQLGISRYEMDRLISRIRERFHKAGLDLGALG